MRFKPAPIVDAALAGALAGERDPSERLSHDQGPARAHDAAWSTSGQHPADKLLKHGRIVLLECGHFAITKARHACGCPRCGAMIRAGYDYDAFRNLGEPDRFSWPDDPLRPLHEVDMALDGGVRAHL